MFAARRRGTFRRPARRYVVFERRHHRCWSHIHPDANLPRTTQLRPFNGALERDRRSAVHRDPRCAGHGARGWAQEGRHDRERARAGQSEAWGRKASVCQDRDSEAQGDSKACRRTATRSARARQGRWRSRKATSRLTGVTGVTGVGRDQRATSASETPSILLASGSSRACSPTMWNVRCVCTSDCPGVSSAPGELVSIS